MKTAQVKLFALFLLCGGALIFTRCSSDEATDSEGGEDSEELTADYEQGTTPPDELCIADPSWFPHSQTPRPLEGKDSPFDAESTTNQIFHQWSWQKFLWVTKPVNNLPQFLIPNKITIQVDANMAPVKVPDGSNVALVDTEQAGQDEAILQVNPNYGQGNADLLPETVYYSIHVNRLMLQSARQFKEDIVSGAIPEDNKETFPVGSYELKVSWVNVNTIPEGKRGEYFTTMGSISTDGGKTFENVEVAMLGMHVVGVVENHPEFIWATFEHDDLAPNYDWEANNASSSSEQLLFQTGSTTGINGILYDKTTQLGKDPFHVFDLFTYGIPVSPGGQFMEGTSQDPKENFQNVDGINDCVKSNLKDVWVNYFYNGSIWLDMDHTTPEEQADRIYNLGYSIGDAKKGSYARGSLNCANVTMETFTQTFQTDIQDINVGNLANCFSCHSSPQFFNKSSSDHSKSPLYLSHAFQGMMGAGKGLSGAEFEQLKSEHERRLQNK